MDTKIVVGADPEAFLSRIADGKLFVVPPAKLRIDHKYPTTFLKSDIKHKHPVFKTGEGIGGNVHVIEDGAALELTVPPATSMETLYENIQLGYSMMKGIADEFGCGLSVIPTINFDIEEFKGREEEFLMSLIFGCDRDMDVFEIQDGLLRECPEEDALLHPFRYGGGHVHTSGCQWFIKKPLLAVKMLAFFVGTLVTFKSPNPELDYLRVYRYGRPGRFRIQEYGNKFQGMDFTETGIEYRTPSNAWTTNLSLAKDIERMISLVAERVMPDDELMVKLINEVQKDAVNSVMNGDRVLAEKVHAHALSLI